MQQSSITFTKVVGDYIEEKRAAGCDFTKEAQTLRRIVRQQEQTDGGMPCLSAELRSRWIEKTPWENETNRRNRIGVLRGLGSFMTRMGYQSVVIPHRLTQVADYDYTPYIFSENELGRLLQAVDDLCERGISNHSDLVFPLVFRILIGCGTRITETLRIGETDVDLQNGTIVLLNTKNKKERIIPIATTITERCRTYVAKSSLVRGFGASQWFFPNNEGKTYVSGSLYSFYRTALHRAGISHGGRGRGPRLHDLRHTFAVRVLQKWVRNRQNLTTALPYLAIYMGHEGLKASQHYLRLTTTMFPELIKTVETKFGWVIPEAYRG